MDLWLQLWRQEAVPGSPSGNLEETSRKESEERKTNP